MAPMRVILMSCGSYNPPTIMHLRMFELARDHLHKMGSCIVVGGVISPTHDAYGKQDLVNAAHRCAMLRLALQNSDWIRLSTWETRQNGWTRTKASLQHHQNLLNSVVYDSSEIKSLEIEDLEWIPENVKNSCDQPPIQIRLLCGGDLLESFGTYGLWLEEDIDAIVGQHGLVVVTRQGSNPNKFIYESDILYKYVDNIIIVTEWIPNDISSTRIRRALKRGENIRFFVQDSVIDYIYSNEIYDSKKPIQTIKLELSPPDANNYLSLATKYSRKSFITPSPTDVTMESPSPIEVLSIDVPDSVLRKNLQNSNNVPFTGLINALSENGKQVVQRSTYPGQAKQIITTESGESQILQEDDPQKDQKSSESCVKITEICSPHVENRRSLENDKNDYDSFEINTDKEELDSKYSHETEGQKKQLKKEETKKKEANEKPLEKVYTSVGAQAEFDIDVDKLKEYENTDYYLLKRDSNIEIDGKYLKSTVNTRKSPKKVKTEKIYIYDMANHPEEFVNHSTNNESYCNKAKVSQLWVQERMHPVKPARRECRSQEYLGKREKNFVIPKSIPLKGSLDSAINASDPIAIPRRKSAANDTFSKKSKSYESIKRYEEIFVDDLSNAESKFTTADDVQTDEFCSICCFANEINYLSRQNLSRDGNQDNFYTLRSTCSSLGDEDSTECDICNSWTLQEQMEAQNPAATSTDNICEICEICGEPNTIYAPEDTQSGFKPVEEESSDYLPEYELGSAGFVPIQEIKSDFKSVSEYEPEFISDYKKEPATFMSKIDNKSGLMSAHERSSDLISGYENRMTDLVPEKEIKSSFVPVQESKSDFTSSYEDRKRSLDSEEDIKSSFVPVKETKSDFMPIQEVKPDLIIVDERISDFIPIKELKSGTVKLQETKERFAPIHDLKWSVKTDNKIKSSELSKSTTQLGPVPERRTRSKSFTLENEMKLGSFLSEKERKLSIFVPKHESHSDSFIPKKKGKEEWIKTNSPKIFEIMSADPILDPAAEDRFEIGNVGARSPEEKFHHDVSERFQKEFLKAIYPRSAPRERSRSKHSQSKYRDEDASMAGNRRVSRKGSLVRKRSDEPVAHEKRRYSSADNLQSPNVLFKCNEKYFKSKAAKAASADNLRASRNSKKSKSLQRASKSVSYLDNCDSLIEDDSKDTDNQEARDNETDTAKPACLL
ncbi:uncharacterized protein Nmnat isoform X2 [Prorops nasuta]|uniref:uncharacterized protein Nmnat isoform X2 n=1 Tax=Prorops nasuta TaxID=863751 RepID=UPI0034CF7267